jgi:EpsI family protein
MPRPDLRTWLPTLVLLAGASLLLLAKRQTPLPLVTPLETTVPATLLGHPSTDRIISDEEQAIAGMSDYLLRLYGADSTRYQFSVYVGYYEEQVQGRSIHSPKNCLPGAGWEPINASDTAVSAGGRQYRVNRYLLGNQNARALVYYWYQGRGRVAYNETAVKWDLLRDKAMLGRSEEALVRIVVPVRGAVTEVEADRIAGALAGELIPQVFLALPPGPVERTVAAVSALRSPR